MPAFQRLSLTLYTDTALRVAVDVCELEQQLTALKAENEALKRKVQRLRDGGGPEDGRYDLCDCYVQTRAALCHPSRSYIVESNKMGDAPLLDC